MIKFILCLVLCSISLHADVVWLDPFIMDDSDSQYRRLCVADECIVRIEKKMKGKPEFEKIRAEFETLKFCLGYPIDVKYLHEVTEDERLRNKKGKKKK